MQQDARLLSVQEKKEIRPPGKGGFKSRAARTNLPHCINSNRLQKALSAAAKAGLLIAPALCIIPDYQGLSEVSMAETCRS